MPLFLCKVTNKAGKIEEFTRESTSQDTLIRELQGQGFFPLEIREASAAEKAGAPQKKIRPNAILDFTDTLSLLLSSGLSLKDALLVALTIFKKGHANSIISIILEKINKGSSFHDALDGFGNNFPPLYRGLVRIGEKIGSLDLIFARLAKYLRDNKSIREKIVGSLIYPLIILVFILVGAVLMTVFVFPTLGGIFSQFSAQDVQNIESNLASYNVIMGIIFFLAFVLTGAGIIMGFFRKRGGRIGVMIDGLLLKVPVLGTISLYRESMNFLFAMETLTGSGYSLEEAIGEASHVLKNQALRAALARIRERIIRGDSIADSFREQNVFPERISQWLFVGERSGQVEKVFSQLSAYYQAEIEKWATRFMAWIEPALMLFVGGFVLVFIILFVLPIFQMYGKILK